MKLKDLLSAIIAVIISAAILCFVGICLAIPFAIMCKAVYNAWNLGWGLL